MNAPSERPLAALSGFEPVARGVPGEDANRASERDGLVCLTRGIRSRVRAPGRRARVA